MAEIRLNKLIKQFNIGLDTLVDFLNSKGAGLENANPNMKVSDEFLPELHKKFGKDLELKEAAEKVDVKLTEILDKASRRPAGSREEEDEYEPERITVIKSTNLSHPYMTTGKAIALTRWTFVGKEMSLLFNMPSRLVITFLPRIKCLLISWLQSPSTMTLEPPKIKSLTVSIVSLSICHEVMEPDAIIFVF